MPIYLSEHELRSVIRKALFEDDGLFSDARRSGEGSVSSNTGKKRNNQDGDLEYSVNQVSGNYPKENIDLVVKELKAAGITNQYAIMGICSTIAKESGFVLQNEKGYSGTSVSRIKQIFANNKIHCDVDNIQKGTKFNTLTDRQIESLKSSNEKFFNALYGGWLGNNCENDGWKYRGRGFIQLTGRANYRKAGYESNPDAVNSPSDAAKVVAKYMTEFHNSVWSKADLNAASSPEQGVAMAADKVAGRKNASRAQGHAMARLDQFKQMFASDTATAIAETVRGSKI